MTTKRKNWDTKLHKDGTITYWSVYNQIWIKRASSIPDRELAAMAEDERDAVMNHLELKFDHA